MCTCGENCDQTLVYVYSHPSWKNKLVVVIRHDIDMDEFASSFLLETDDKSMVKRESDLWDDCDIEGLDSFMG